MKDGANLPPPAPVIKHKTNEHAGYDLVLLVGPHALTKHFNALVDLYKTSGLSYCIIGDGKSTVTLDDMDRELKGNLGVTPRVDKTFHAGATNGELFAELHADPEAPYTRVSDILSTLTKCADGVPMPGMQTHIWSCESGTSAKMAHLLPPGSFAYTHTGEDMYSMASLDVRGLMAGVSRYIKQRDPLQEFVENFLESPATVTITSASSGANKEPLHFTARAPKSPISDDSLRTFLLDVQDGKKSSSTLSQYLEAIDIFYGDAEHSAALVKKIEGNISKTYSHEALLLQIDNANLEYLELARKQPGFDINVPKMPDGDTAMHLAVFSKSRAMMKAVLAAGGEINQRSNDGNTALHIGATHSPATVELLLQAKANVNAVSNDSATPLDLALVHRENGHEHTQTINTLIKGGANVYRNNPLRGSPLNLAVHYGQISAAKVLVSAGALLGIHDDDMRHLTTKGGVELVQFITEEQELQKKLTPLHDKAHEAIKSQSPEFYSQNEDILITALYLLSKDRLALPTFAQQRFVPDCAAAVQKCMKAGVLPSYTALKDAMPKIVRPVAVRPTPRPAPALQTQRIKTDEHKSSPPSPKELTASPKQSAIAKILAEGPRAPSPTNGLTRPPGSSYYDGRP